MKKIKFFKMQGAGNDFVLLKRDEVPVKITPRVAKLLLDRHYGVGGDQLLVYWETKNRIPNRFLDIYNSDGTKAEMCGNGVRALGHYLATVEKQKINEFWLSTKAGLISVSLNPLEVNMGKPILEGRRIPVRADGEIINRSLKVAGKIYRIHAVSMGNPHCVIFVKDVDSFPVKEVGPLIENHPFFPKRVNVEFVQVLNKKHVKARVWERGAGETLACGTGACAIAVAAHRFGKTHWKIKIDLPGGRLQAEWGNSEVYLSGPAEVTYQGEFLFNS